MAATLRHRGPDALGGRDDRWASFGHARLSVIDPAAGRQPMTSEDGTVCVVFNGEIYNHRELAAGLRARGHRLLTRCDTEVIAHLYEEHGDDFALRLNGMFAIALWDARRHRLVLVRDRMGIKPLYWQREGDRAAFGSELKALLAAAPRPAMDPAALKDYLTFGHVPAPRTIWQGISKLEPGCMVVCTAGGTRLRRYWDIPGPAESAGSAGTDWVGRFADLLDDAVAGQLEADVPLGAFLSGGVDSAAVVAAMCRHASGPVLTHTVGFDESDLDERNRAREIASFLGTDHRELVVRPDAVAVAGLLARHFDEPFADPCAVPACYLARAARRRVTVALSGDGPDEMLAGYRRYRFDLAESAARSIAPGWLRRGTFGVAGWLYPKADWLPRSLRAKRTLQNLSCDDATAHLRSVAMAAGELPDLLLSADLAREVADHDSFARGRALFNRGPSGRLLDRLLYVDMKTLLADEILTKADRTSMAVGLEVRVPFLDHRLVELAAGLPADLRPAVPGKRVLRDVVARWLGPRFATTPKHGFDVPAGEWFRGPAREALREALLPGDAACRQWLEPRVVERLVRHHLSGIGDHGRTLWALFMLEQWAAIDPAGPGPEEPGIGSSVEMSAIA
jgi:asparagine synthase (glutamine-hydrolysing)